MIFSREADSRKSAFTAKGSPLRSSVGRKANTRPSKARPLWELGLCVLVVCFGVCFGVYFGVCFGVRFGVCLMCVLVGVLVCVGVCWCVLVCVGFAYVLSVLSECVQSVLRALSVFIVISACVLCA